MPYILDYLDSCRYKNFDEDSFNEIDALCLCNFSYTHLEKVFKYNEHFLGLNIKKACQRFNNLDDEDMTYREQKDLVFINKFKDTWRFNRFKIYYYDSFVSLDRQYQFGAFTIDFEKFIAVVFRGTDNSLIGWKEDFNMSFKKEIPSQKFALDYLNKVGAQFNKKIIVMGHSKGGNLAIYSSFKCLKKIQKKIVNVYNFDGPGFNKKVYEEFSKTILRKKIKAYAPESSIIGLLMKNVGNYIYVKSNSYLIFQHNPYTWKVDGNTFLYAKTNNGSSKFIENILNDVYNNLTIRQKKIFVEGLYQIVLLSGVNDYRKIIKGLFKNRKVLLEHLNKLDEKTKKVMQNVLNLIFESAKDNIERNIKKIFKK